MGTRGSMDFIVDGVTKKTYNHFDSYPDGLGVDILKWLRTVKEDEAAGMNSWDQVIELARHLKVVSDDSTPPTDNQIAICKAHGIYDPNVGGHTRRPSWYQLLRGCQGDPGKTLSIGRYEDGALISGQEYVYEIDFDKREFRSYEADWRDGSKGGLLNTVDFDSPFPTDEEYALVCNASEEANN